MKRPYSPNSVTIVATVVIAIATCVYMGTTIGILLQMNKDSDLQRNYYEKTMRPFVYAHTLTVTDVEQPVTKGSKVKLQYSIKNVGVLPAKELLNSSEFEKDVSENFKRIGMSDIQWDHGVPLKVSGLYPQQETLGFAVGGPGFFTVDDLMRHKFAHILVAYSDSAGRRYYYKLVIEMRMSIDSGKLNFQALHRWADFD